jgi:hypothetical protein
VDYSNITELIVAAWTLTLGTGDNQLMFGEYALTGIGTAPFGATLRER